MQSDQVTLAIMVHISSRICRREGTVSGLTSLTVPQDSLTFLSVKSAIMDIPMLSNSKKVRIAETTMLG